MQNVKTVINSKIEQVADAGTLAVGLSAPSLFSFGNFLDTITFGGFSGLLAMSRASSIVSVESVVEYSIMPIVTGYSPWGEEAITSLDLWEGLKMTTLLHFQRNDEVISNKDNVEFAKKLIKHNPEQTFVVLGNDGGHNYGFATIDKVIDNFNFRNGGSYNYNKTTKIGAEILDQSQPTVDNVEDFFNKK